jgi:hypothetical protein
VVVCAVSQDGSGFITHNAGRNTPRSNPIRSEAGLA